MPGIVFWTSYVLLWLLAAGTLAAVFLLFRYHGQVLAESREGRMTQGPKLDEPLPAVTIRDEAGVAVEFGGVAPHPRFVMMTRATREPCKTARKDLSAFARTHLGILETVLVCSGKPQEIATFVEELSPEVHVVPDLRAELAARCRVGTSPFAMVLDEQAVVRSKGMPATLQGFQALIEAAWGPTTQRTTELSFVADGSR